MPELWHEAGDLVQSPAVKQVISRALMYLEAGYSIHLSGPPGTGKTALAIHLANRFDRPYVFLHGDGSRTAGQMRDQATSFERFFVHDNFVRDVQKGAERTNLKHSLSSVQKACIHGYFLIYDEFNRSRAEVNNILLPVLSEGVLPMNQNEQSEQNTIQEVHPGFRMIATSNSDDAAGTFQTQEALLDRIVTISLKGWDQETELSILQFHAGLSEADAGRIIRILTRLREALAPQTGWPSIRLGIMLAKTLRHAEIPIDPLDPVFQLVCCDILNVDVIAPAKTSMPGLRTKIAAVWKEIFQLPNARIFQNHGQAPDPPQASLAGKNLNLSPGGSPLRAECVCAFSRERQCRLIHL